MFASMRPNIGMDFLNADGAVLHSMRSPGVVPEGWHASQFFHQPACERTLRKTVVAFEESAEEVEGHYFYIALEEYRVIRLDSVILSFPHE